MEALSPNTGCDNEARALKSLVDTFGSMLSNGWVKSETSSKPSDKNALSKSSFANGNSYDESRLERGSFSGGTLGKEYVWRAKTGSDGNLVGEAINGKLESPFVDDDAFNKSCCVNGGDESKTSRTKMNTSYTVGSSWGCGKEPKDYVWRIRGGQDSDPTTEVPRVVPTNPSPDLANESNSKVKSETSSESSSDNHPNSNGNYAQSSSKMNHSSMGTLSGGRGKGYMWRPRKGKDVNLGSPADMVHASNNGGLDSQSSSNNGSYFGNGIDDSQASTLRRDLVPVRASSGGVGKDYVWRVRTKGSSTETKPLTEEANESLGSTCSPEPALLDRDAKSRSNKDFEDFLLDTLGQGFQVERSTVKEVLGNCGYDMKKSLETIMDLVAVNLDRRIDLDKGINSSSSETLSSHNRRGRRTMTSNVFSSRQSNETYNQQKEVSTTLFHVPVGPNSTFSSSASESSRASSEVVGNVLTVPRHEDDAEEFDITKLVRSFGYESLKDEAEEESYRNLRKTVKDFRDTTKEYYKAAAEAFARGDHAQASILLEKGQFFYNKAREADEESAQKILEFRSRDGEIQDDMCLDLQHHNAKEAIRLLKCHLRSLSGILSIKNLKIIYGVGVQEVEKRKRAVIIKLLEKEAIEWTEDEDSGTISICLDRINPKSLSFTENSKAI